MNGVGTFLFGCSIAFLAWAVAQFLRHRQQNERLRGQMELHRLLIEKIASTEDLKVYLESEAFQKGVLEPAPEPEQVRRNVLGGLPTGVLLLIFGFGAALAPMASDGPRWVGVLAIIVGAGFLGAGVISYRLAKSWGMVDEKRASKD